MNRPGLFCLAIVALLLVPSSAAEDLDVDAQRLEARTGLVQAAAAVVHFEYADGATFALTADSVVVTEFNDTYAVATPLVGLEPEQSGPTERFREVRWAGHLGDGGYLFASGGGAMFSVWLDAEDVKAEPSPRETEQALPTPFRHDAAWGVPVSGLLLVETRETQALLTGDFVLRVWSGSITGSSLERSVSLQSGEHRREHEPTGTAYESSELYHVLRVSNGTLAVRAPPTTFVRSYLGDDSTITPWSGSLHGVTGPVGGIVELADGVPLLASTRDDALRVRTAPTAATTAPDAPLGVASSLPFALAAAAAVGLAFFLRSRRPTSVQMLLADMERKRYRRVVRHAGTVMQRSRSEAVAVMKTVALLALGRAETALRYLEDLPAEVRPTDGMHPFLRAHALNEMGEPEQARRSLREALGQNPGLVVELSQLPRLRALLPDDGPPEAYA